MEKSKVIEKLFYYIVTCSYLLLPIGFFVSRNKKKDLVPLFLAIYGLIFFGLLLSYDTLPKEFRKPFQSFYTFLEYAFFAFFFWYNIKNQRFRKLIIILSVLFLLFQIVYFLKTMLIRLDSVPIGVETILLLVYILYFFYEFSQKLNDQYIYNHYCFWISIGVLIYLGGSFFFYILINHLNNDQVQTFGNMTFMAEMIKNILFTVSIFIYSRYPSENTKEKQKSIPYLDLI